MLTVHGRKSALSYLLDYGTTQLKIGLFQNPWGGDNLNTILSDLEPADFEGYAIKSGIEHPFPEINGNDHGETLSPILTWTAGELLEPQTIYGIYATVFDLELEEDVLFWYDDFEASITLAEEGQQVKKRIKWNSTEFIEAIEE